MALANGDIIGGLLDLTQAGVSARRMMQSCFVAGTPLRGVASSQPIERFRSYEEFGDACDSILSRSEFDPSGPLVARRVLRKFVRIAPVLNLHVGGRLIGTTADHPLYVVGERWLPAF